MTVDQWFSSGSNVAVGVAALGASIIALVGLKTWRAELKGKARFEASSKLMVACRKFAHEYVYARSPATYPGESLEREHLPDERDDERRTLDEWYARRKRGERLGRVAEQIQEARWAAEVVLDQTVEGQIKETTQRLLVSVNQLIMAIDFYFGNQRISNRTGSMDESMNRLMEIQFKNIYAHSQEGEPDYFQAEVDQAVESLRQALRQYLR